MPSCAADSWRYRSCNAACTVLALRSPRRTMASMRVRRAATSANSAATKNAFASTSATTASRRRPSDSEVGSGGAIEAGTYRIRRRVAGARTRYVGEGGKGDEGRVSATLPLDVQCTHRAPLRAESRQRLKTVLVITAVVMVAEAVGGWLAHSLAL